MDSTGGIGRTGRVFLVESLLHHGWKLRQSGEVKCTSPETVLRSDRRGGPTGSGPGPKWDWHEPPPDAERRPLLWPEGLVRPYQRTCAAILLILDKGITFLRPVPVNRSERPYRYLHTRVPDSVVRHTAVCQTCGIMSELVSVPLRAVSVVAADDASNITQFSVANISITNK